MILTLSHCVPADALELARLHHSIFHEPPIYRVTYEGMDAADVLAKHQKGFVTGLEEQTRPMTDNETHYLKMTDDSTSKIAAYVVCSFLPNGYDAEKGLEAQSMGMPARFDMLATESFKRSVAKARSEHG